MSQDDEATTGSTAEGGGGSAAAPQEGGEHHQGIADPGSDRPATSSPDPAPSPAGGGDGEAGARAAKVAAPVAAAFVFVAALALAAVASDSSPEVVAGSASRSPTTTEAAEEVAAPAADDDRGDGGDGEAAGVAPTDAPTTEPPATTEAPTTVPPTTVSPTTEAPPTEAPATTVPPTTAPPTTEPSVGGSEVTPAATDAAQPVRHAVIRQGVVYLRGSIPSREAADEIIRKAEGVVGPGNVVDEYVIDPSAPLVSSAPLYVEDLILFPTNSSEIAPDFVPLLELGMALLTQNPKVSITVIGHTDAVGSPQYNMALSERRVASVIEWFTSRGIDPSRLTGEARGLTDPLVPAEPGQAEALNRRVEFVITGLLED